ncbi:hypothetical protein C8Q76DRAFT_752930 [Earliella scabrosa]|nr:hypothetical protein C8Q76DRAFT_752930 [Earliella scabrosa]
MCSFSLVLLRRLLFRPSTSQRVALYDHLRAPVIETLQRILSLDRVACAHGDQAPPACFRVHPRGAMTGDCDQRTSLLPHRLPHSRPPG